MRMAFVGPSLRPEVARAIAADANALRPPAAAGDVVRALADGASAIGIVDGVFGAHPAVRHGEILLALACGVPVLGAASLGALRAAELAAFGMTGIGVIFAGFASGALTSDSDVALLHGPAETGWTALSEPLVDVLATIDAAQAERIVDADAASRLRAAAGSTFYADRRWPTLAETLPACSRDRLLAWLPTGRRSVKADDAAALLRALAAPLPSPPPVDVPRTQALDQLVRSSVGDAAADALWRRARRPMASV